MLRTLISLCALLAALFFVFRGIQESSAKGQTPSGSRTASRMPDDYRQLILQRARNLRESERTAQRDAASHAEALELTIDELNLGWQLLEMLAEEEVLAERTRQQSIKSTYSQQVTESADMRMRLDDPFFADEESAESNETENVDADTQRPDASPVASESKPQPVTTEAHVADATVAEQSNPEEIKDEAHEEVASETVEPAIEKRQLSRSEQILSNKIKYCLNVYRSKMEISSRDKNCWELMHTMIGYGVDNHVWVGRNRFNTIGYLCWNGKCKGFNLFETENGQLQAKQGYGVQGHHGQFLAMLAQHRISPEYVIKVDDQEFTIEDLIEFEKQTCVPKSELTFKLIALMHYLDSDATWTNEHGQWSIPRLIHEELAQPVVGSACGGTHRLMGLSYAARCRETRQEPMTGEWKRALEFTDAYHEYAFNLQNRNGSFSTKWFEGRADNSDTQRYQETSGHITEWLAYSLPKERLYDRRMVAAVNFVANLLLENHDFEWKIGPRGHAIRALALYHERAYGEQVTVRLANKTGTSGR